MPQYYIATQNPKLKLGPGRSRKGSRVQPCSCWTPGRARRTFASPGLGAATVGANRSSKLERAPRRRPGGRTPLESLGPPIAAGGPARVGAWAGPRGPEARRGDWGPRGTCAPPAAPRPRLPLFLAQTAPHRPLRPPPASAAAGNQAAQRAGCAAVYYRLLLEPRPPFTRSRRPWRRGAWPSPHARAAGCCGLLCQLAWRHPLKPKNSFLTQILLRIKTLIFFCFVSQNVSSKECRTLKTNLAFFACTGYFLFVSPDVTNLNHYFLKLDLLWFLLHHYRFYKGIIFPFQIKKFFYVRQYTIEQKAQETF